MAKMKRKKNTEETNWKYNLNVNKQWVVVCKQHQHQKASSIVNTCQMYEWERNKIVEPKWHMLPLFLWFACTLYMQYNNLRECRKSNFYSGNMCLIRLHSHKNQFNLVHIDPLRVESIPIEVWSHRTWTLAVLYVPNPLQRGISFDLIATHTFWAIWWPIFLIINKLFHFFQNLERFQMKDLFLNSFMIHIHIFTSKYS